MNDSLAAGARRARKVLAAAAALAFTGSAAGAESAAQIRALWDETIEHGSRTQLMATYDVVNALHDGQRALSSEECRAQSAALDKAMQDNPVGLAVWYVAYLCADQLGDKRAATQRLDRFSALVKYGIDNLPPDHGATPMRVVGPIDADAFIAASGQQLLHRSYDVLREGRELPLRAVLWDAERKRERWISFDYIDTLTRMSEKAWMAAPAYRHQLVLGVLKHLDDADSKEALALIDAMHTERSARVAKLQELAGASFAAASMLADLCLKAPQLHCDTQAVDALLPFVEQHDAGAMIVMARHYEAGRGVERDTGAARKLLAAADARLGDGWGTLMFAAFAAEHPGTAIPELVRNDVEALARKGSPFALTLSAAVAIDRSGKREFPPEAVRQLTQAAEGGLPLAQGLIATHLLSRHEYAAALPWLRRAAENHAAAAEAALAGAYDKGAPELSIAPDAARALQWYTAAGADGEVGAMLWLGYHYLDNATGDDDLTSARGWFRSADGKGSSEGALQLAGMFRDGKGSDEGTPASALAIYRYLAEKRHYTAGRRAWARLLRDGADGVPQDLPQARKLFEEDAEKGDAISQYDLGALLLGDYAVHDVDAGLSWMRKSAEQGNSFALHWMAWEYEHGKHVKADPAKAVAQYRLAIGKGSLVSMDRLAEMAIDGRGMQADTALADQLLRDAAEKGDSEAMWRLGKNFRAGRGEPVDAARAIEWYRRSAEHNNFVGMSGLGQMLINDADPKQQADGIEWLKRAAARGSETAMNELGVAYEGGKVVAADADEAAKWYAAGDKAGSTLATNNLAALKVNGPKNLRDAEGARALWEKAVADGSTSAMGNLGRTLRDGLGGAKDQKRGWDLLRQCADQGDASCVDEVAYGYRYGWVDGKVDYATAKKYWQRLPDDANAQADLAEIEYREHIDDDAQVRSAIDKLHQLADGGNSKAQLLYAESCLLGVTGPRDGVCAREYLEKSTSAHYPAAYTYLGLLYESNLGGPVDLDKAEHWLRYGATELHNAFSRRELARLLMHRGKAEEAVKLLLQSLDDGNQQVDYLLLRHCREHPDCAVSAEQRKTLQKRLDELSAPAHNNVSWMLATNPLSDAVDGRYAVDTMLALIKKDDKPDMARLDTLAAAYARAGDFANAVQAQQQVVDMIDAGKTNQRATMTRRLETYRAGKTWDVEM